MQFSQPLIEGRLVRRYKRFLADVELPGGQIVVAHCPNPGSMHTCAPDRAPVWLMHHDSPTRRLAYTWELVETEHGMVCVNTARANEVVAEALHGGVIAELTGYDRVAREVVCGAGSRIDFVLSRQDIHCYVEVKSVTLHAGPALAAFPDAVTARGTRHLCELMALAAAGHRAVLLFCASRSDARTVRPADEIDPLYGHTLRQAAAAGVDILAYRCDVSPHGIWLRERVPVLLPAAPPLSAALARRAAAQAAAASATSAQSGSDAPRIIRGAKKTVRLRDRG